MWNYLVDVFTKPTIQLSSLDKIVKGLVEFVAIILIIVILACISVWRDSLKSKKGGE